MEIDSILDDDLEIIEVKDVSMSTESLPAIKKKTDKNNPVEKHLFRQLQCVQNQLEQVNSNVVLIQNVTEKILNNLSNRAAYREDDSSDADSDLYISTGEPVIKKKKNKIYVKTKVLSIESMWQRVIGNKWIIGVVIKNNTTCVLKDPTIYMCRKTGDNNCHGVSIFWTMLDGIYLYPTEEIEANEQLTATAVLELPKYDSEDYVESHGTIFCEFDDKLFQTPIPGIKLGVEDIAGGYCDLNFKDEDPLIDILALKSVAVDRLLLLPVQSDSNTGNRLMIFLEKHSFTEVCRACVVKKTGSLQYCVLEVLPAEDGEVRILISARSEAQLSVVIQLMRKDFPELLDVEKQQAIDEAAEALRLELQLYLTCDNAAELQRARIKTDLLID